MTKVDYKKFLDDSMLSPQEKLVLKYRKQGVSGREIAEKLGIKIESVWVISHNIVLKCTGKYDNKKHYEYVKKSFEKRMSESEENQKKFKEQQKKYRVRNKDKIKEYNKEYYVNNKNKISEHQKEYYHQNRDGISEYQKKYYEKNRDKIAKKQKEYYNKKRKENISSVKAERIKRNSEIYKMFLSGETVQNISKKLGVSRQTIYNVLSEIKQSHPGE